MLNERIENKTYLSKVISVEEAVKLVPKNASIAISGFTKSGEPKTFIPALGRYFANEHTDARITLLSGASLSEEVEKPIAPFVHRRAPYMSSSESRKRILARTMEYSDIHLSHFSRHLMYGFYGEIDFAIIEISKITKEGGVILTSSVGISVEALLKAKKIILEINTALPDYSGLHDIAVLPVYPNQGNICSAESPFIQGLSCGPLMINNVEDRIGTPHVQIDFSKVVAIVESNQPDFGVPFKKVSQMEQKIASHVIEYLIYCQKKFNWGDQIPPLQSGVGNIANAVVSELYYSPFKKLRFWTEVFQEGMLKFLEDEDKFEGASTAALSFSDEGWRAFYKIFSQNHKIKNKIILRPTWISNSPEVISRLFVVAMNTCIEMDLFGHANSTHIDGSNIVNGLGGSGDFLRNAYLSIVHIPSIRKLKDGRVVSTIMPFVRHVDHTEHDLKCVITENGIMTNTDIVSPYQRAMSLIENCAHPYFQPLLKEYLRLAGSGDEPRLTNIDLVKGWWAQYERACLEFKS